MIEHADVIVIGSGGLGAATAFYLVKRGARNVALIDKHDIGSQTSPRAAGMVSCVRKSELMIELISRLRAGIRTSPSSTTMSYAAGGWASTWRASRPKRRIA